MPTDAECPHTIPPAAAPIHAHLPAEGASSASCKAACMQLMYVRESLPFAFIVAYLNLDGFLLPLGDVLVFK